MVIKADGTISCLTFLPNFYQSSETNSLGGKWVSRPFQIDIPASKLLPKPSRTIHRDPIPSHLKLAEESGGTFSVQKGHQHNLLFSLFIVRPIFTRPATYQNRESHFAENSSTLNWEAEKKHWEQDIVLLSQRFNTFFLCLVPLTKMPKATFNIIGKGC